MQSILHAAAWVWAHSPYFASTATVLILLSRQVPQHEWLLLEAQWPRVANLVRLLRAMFPDIAKAARALIAIWTGQPWRILIIDEQPASKQLELPLDNTKEKSNAK